MILILCWSWREGSDPAAIGQQGSGDLEQSTIRPSRSAGDPDSSPVERTPLTRGLAPPGRGDGEEMVAVVPSASGTDDDRRQTMNGEVRAFAFDADGQAVESWLFVSDDCGVRVWVDDEELRVLSPPGDCRFQARLGEEEDSPSSEWVVAEVLPNESIYLELEILPYEPGQSTDTAF